MKGQAAPISATRVTRAAASSTPLMNLCDCSAPNIFAIFAGHGFQRVRSRDGLIEVPDPLSPAQKHVLAALGIASSLPPQGSLRP